MARWGQGPHLAAFSSSSHTHLEGGGRGTGIPAVELLPPTPCPGPVFVHSVQGRVHSLAWPQHVNPAQAPRRQHALACDLRPLLRVTTLSEPQFPRP